MNPIETETTQRNNQKNENIEKLKNQHLPSVEKIKKTNHLISVLSKKPKNAALDKKQKGKNLQGNGPEQR